MTTAAPTARMAASSRPLLTILGSTANETNAQLLRVLRGRGLDVVLESPAAALVTLRPRDVALARLDVSPGLDGVEPGLLALLRLERRGVCVLNRARTLLTVHDKRRTAAALERAAVPHPRTRHVAPGAYPGAVAAPVVVKPRFGSWGRDVLRCETTEDLRAAWRQIEGRSWFRRHGALVQELVPPRGHDLRVIVAGGTVVGGVRRVAAPGEWRTNVSLGGSPEPAVVPPAARALALAAASAVGGDVVGVDLLPVDHGWVVLEMNGAVEFDQRYARAGRDVYADVLGAVLASP